MKFLSRIFRKLFLICIFLSGCVDADLNLPYLWEFKGASDLRVNENCEVIWIEWSGNKSNIFYSNPRSSEYKIDVTDFVSEQLIKLGYKPKTYSGEASHRLDWMNDGLDKDSNLLLRFYYDTGNDKDWCSKIGVWNPKHGFKIINTYEISEISEIKRAGEFLFVCGRNAHGCDKIIVLSVAGGYW